MNTTKAFIAEHVIVIALFPGHSHLQFLITCSNYAKKNEGEGLEERVMCMT